MLPDPRCHGQGGVNWLRPPGARRAVPVENPSLAGDESGCAVTLQGERRDAASVPDGVRALSQKKQAASGHSPALRFLGRYVKRRIVNCYFKDGGGGGEMPRPGSVCIFYLFDQR